MWYGCVISSKELVLISIYEENFLQPFSYVFIHVLDPENQESTNESLP